MVVLRPSSKIRITTVSSRRGEVQSRNYPQVLVKTARKHALLGGVVQAVVADLDHAHADVGGAPGVVDVVAAQRHAEVADLPLGDLLAEHFPQVVAVEHLPAFRSL